MSLTDMSGEWEGWSYLVYVDTNSGTVSYTGAGIHWGFSFAEI